MRTVARAKLHRLDLARDGSHQCPFYKRLGWLSIRRYCSLFWYSIILLDSHKFEVQGTVRTK